MLDLLSETMWPFLVIARKPTVIKQYGPKIAQLLLLLPVMINAKQDQLVEFLQMATQ
jgi:hypothetical protein